MVFVETKLKGSFIIELERLEDERGFFARSFCQKEFEEHGLNPRIVQCNVSFNKKKGTLRGMHYQVAPHEEAKLVKRFLLYYTGLRRMAKNILRNIVEKYLDRDVTTLQTIDRLREVSFEMKVELDHRNIDAFGKKIAEVWELNKTLDPGTSNEEIEAILSKISHLIHGAKLLGAGGGGFLFIVTKGTVEAQKVKQILTEEPPNDRARFFDFHVDAEGLKINVL